MDAAYELYLTSRELEHVMWRRLIMIAMEDIGFGSLQAVNIVYSYYQAKDLFERDKGTGSCPLSRPSAICADAPRSVPAAITRTSRCSDLTGGT